MNEIRHRDSKMEDIRAAEEQERVDEFEEAEADEDKVDEEEEEVVELDEEEEEVVDIASLQEQLNEIHAALEDNGRLDDTLLNKLLNISTVGYTCDKMYPLRSFLQAKSRRERIRRWHLGKRSHR